MKRLFAVLLVCTLFLSGCNAQGGAWGDKMIGLCLPPQGEGWTGMLMPLAKERAQQLGYEVVAAPIRDVPGGLVAAVSSLIEQKVSIVVLYARDAQSGKEAAALLEAAKIRLVLVGYPVPKAQAAAMVVADNRQIGAQAAQLIAQKIEEKGNVVIIKGPDDTVSQERCAGFRKEMSGYPDIEIIGEVNGGYDKEVARVAMELFLEDSEQVDAVFAQSDAMAMGAIGPLASAYNDTVKMVVSVGGSEEAVRCILKNHRYLKATFAYQPSIAAQAVEAAVALLKGEKLEDEGVVTLPVRSIGPRDAQAWLDEGMLH